MIDRGRGRGRVKNEGAEMSGRMLKRVLLALAIAVLAIGIAGTAAAQKKKSAGGVIRLEETVIEGRVQKPNAFFINTRQALVYEVMELRESFVSEISKAVEEGSF
jgi:hypothetical protein